jgi:hypothetical protein
LRGIIFLVRLSWSRCLVSGRCISAPIRQETIMDGQDDAPRRWRVVVVGPLAPFADGLRGALAGQGYAGDTVTDHVHLLADFSGWLGGQGLDAAGVTEERAGQFLRTAATGVTAPG